MKLFLIKSINLSDLLFIFLVHINQFLLVFGYQFLFLFFQVLRQFLFIIALILQLF